MLTEQEARNLLAAAQYLLPRVAKHLSSEAELIPCRAAIAAAKDKVKANVE